MGIDWLIAVRGDARFFVEGGIEGGVPAEQTRFFNEAGQAARFCQTLARPGDLILVKGSRAVHLEKAVEILVDGLRPKSAIDQAPHERLAHGQLKNP